jgi:excisionase family DNA binding protein
MIDITKPLFTLSIAEFLELQKIQQNQQPSKKFEATYLTVDETCNYLNIAKSTLYAYTSKRLIPFIKRGRKLLFLKSDLDNWLSEARKLTIEEFCKARM